ncbi:hypothetical protein ACHAW5_007196 [Stephanodiscus triporus]|uniref:DNA (cytosine-5-)-methyltransferase n=1 Tax=Stephanodiscus triporus TaxID=2934178 RepID=A0ABD3MJA1_9STRA
MECKKDSNGSEFYDTSRQLQTELRQIGIDAIMLLQEMLFNLGERTSIVDAPSDKEQPPRRENDGNKGIVISAMKELGLSPRQISDLFARLKCKNGKYSINDALMMKRQIEEEEQIDSSDSGSDGESCEDDNVRSGDDGSTDTQPLALLGSRVRTVFEDGREYEGTISHVHYRVVYDDGETETLESEAEVGKKLVCNDMVLGSSLCNELRCLELFSGCSLLSTLCRRKGMNCTSIDHDANSNATIKADFSSEYIQSMLASQIFDYIHASPVCSTYSYLAGGKHRDSNNYNKTQESHEADGLLWLLYSFIAKQLKKSKRITVTIENPRGWMSRGNIMKDLFEKKLGFNRYLIYYCQFGRSEKKPTNIWTNDDKLGKILEAIGGTCNCPPPHEDGVRGAGTKNFAALPMKLCEVISEYVTSKHSQLRFDDVLLRSDRHDGIRT